MTEPMEMTLLPHLVRQSNMRTSAHVNYSMRYRACACELPHAQFFAAHLPALWLDDGSLMSDSCFPGAGVLQHRLPAHQLVFPAPAT